MVCWKRCTGLDSLKIGQCGFPNTANGFDIGVVINKLLAAKFKGEGVKAVKAF
jgi:hypothetical protein